MEVWVVELSKEVLKGPLNALYPHFHPSKGASPMKLELALAA
uniref:Uncharacterized protein n=1 Tax=Picea glauca TaxID=3330 RepID=A0A101M381_PICGL|nr:hypothetical protein ABT39_MTgene74 [Picea glauca]